MALIALVASPVAESWKVEPRDDVPLLYFGTIPTDRSDSQRATYLVGLSAGGQRQVIPYQYAGRGDMEQVRSQITKLVDRGEAIRVCDSVASRVARSGTRLPDIRTVEVTTGTFSLSEYVAGRTAPTDETVRARCGVVRSR